MWVAAVGFHDVDLGLDTVVLEAGEGDPLAVGGDRWTEVDALMDAAFTVIRDGQHVAIFSTVRLHNRALSPSGSVTSVRWSVPGGAAWNVDVRHATSLIYRDAAALPRFFVVPRAVSTHDAAAALAMLHRGAVDRSRASLKPEIPPVGAYGIPLRDEIELERQP